MKRLNIVKKFGNKFVVVGTAAMVATGNALAAVPTEVTTALTDAKTDSVTVAGSVIAIVVAIAAFMFMRRAIK